MADPTLTVLALAFLGLAAVVGVVALTALIWLLGDLRREVPVVVTVDRPGRPDVARAA